MARVKPILIGIAGGTASGKTTVARRIAEALGETATLIEQDAYYQKLTHLPLEQRREVNFDHPDAFDVPLLVEHLRALRAGKGVDKPVYDFADYDRASETTRVEPARIVLVEGILVLWMTEVRSLLDVKIFVDAEDDVRVLRRVDRDVKERGRSLDSVVEQYFRTVRPMHQGFVEPSKRWADIIIPHGGNNPTAIAMVATALRGRLEGIR